MSIPWTKNHLLNNLKLIHCSTLSTLSYHYLLLWRNADLISIGFPCYIHNIHALSNALSEWNSTIILVKILILFNLKYDRFIRNGAREKTPVIPQATVQVQPTQIRAGVISGYYDKQIRGRRQISLYYY